MVAVFSKLCSGCILLCIWYRNFDIAVHITRTHIMKPPLVILCNCYLNYFRILIYCNYRQCLHAAMSPRPVVFLLWNESSQAWLGDISALLFSITWRSLHTTCTPPPPPPTPNHPHPHPTHTTITTTTHAHTSLTLMKTNFHVLEIRNPSQM